MVHQMHKYAWRISDANLVIMWSRNLQSRLRSDLEKPDTMETCPKAPTLLE